ncbi:ADP-ribose pyrophosphatase YjhB, NUDIX family [Sinosporangium album]|uniref:ADP-ribose pyrophosphatase YjhB, NUDIX family n=1 Tax=Sinosporangium album TaxID=504805 RepID=A0A1G7Y791_9ACTN|nr:NUDIX domain-containing protein [Sinosporangium album]SDG92291.1 ADP-ribose pyrophosphatase YjhB, NUDIX family [Sinosporangium album]
MGAIISDRSGRLLLIKRGRPPARGSWSLPGGRVEPGESDGEAVRREVLEETGLRVVVGGLAGTVERPGPGGVTYVIRDYLAVPAAHARDGDGEEGEDVSPTAGDDAEDARWFTHAEAVRLPLSEGLVEALTEWRILSPDQRSNEVRQISS